MIEIDLLADRIGAILQAREAELKLEQSVYGMDSLDEVALQAIVATGLAANHAIAREVHYPSSAGKKLSSRMRCDLVLTPTGKPLKLDSKPATLFDPLDQTAPGDAFWLEVKSAYQFRAPDVRHGGYGQQWRIAVVEDLRKMDADPLIRHAALLLIVFTESLEVVEKDLDLFETVLIQKEVLAGFRQSRHVPITDRIGHKVCTAAVWPTVAR